jgi:hypothetical protein
MSIKATIELGETRLVWLQTTECRTKLHNGEDNPLWHINLQNRRASATISVTDVKSGETTFHAQSLAPEANPSSVSLKPGRVLEEVFDLAARFQFPSCGVFELRARYEWAEGSIESDPVRVEVLPATPQSLFTASARGGETGEVFCVWVNREQGDFSFYLTQIDTETEARFGWSRQLEHSAGGVTPILSVPTNTIPTRQYVASISGNKLNLLKLENGQWQANCIELDADGYVIVPPILQDMYVDGNKREAEILLLKKGLTGWQMRVASLGESPSLGEESGPLGGALPNWFQTTYRDSGERYTFILLPQVSAEGNPYVKLAVSLWAPGVTPAKPVFLNNWPGNLLAADMSRSGDNKIVGAVLTKLPGEETGYQIQKWQFDTNYELALSPMPPLLWDKDWNIELSILRVNKQGEAFLLLKGGPEGKWFWVDQTGEIAFLSELSSQINLPADIIFVDQLFPALLFTDQSCGLKLAGPRTLMSSSSAGRHMVA